MEHNYHSVTNPIRVAKFKSGVIESIVTHSDEYDFAVTLRNLDQQELKLIELALEAFINGILEIRKLSEEEQLAHYFDKKEPKNWLGITESDWTVQKGKGLENVLIALRDTVKNLYGKSCI